MATAQILINRACRLNKIVQSGAAASANQSADALEALNAMLDAWRNDRMMVYAMTDSPLTMVASTSSYTVGTGGDLNISRPVKFEDAFMRIGATDTPVELIDQIQYDGIPDKTVTSSIVSRAFYNPTMVSSLGTLKVWPVPSSANALHMVYWVQLVSIATLGTTITLPPGYEEAIVTNLAVRIKMEYSDTIPPLLLKMASDALAGIKRINSPEIRSYSPMAQAMYTKRSNILVGQ